jgi:SWIM zinc finger
MIPYFAQKSLAASLLQLPASRILTITTAEGWAIVKIKDQPYPTAVSLLELEFEHDRQRRERGKVLPILAIDPETGATYFGEEWPAPLHLASLDSCDCRDFERQRAAGRDRPLCKHVAALQWQASQVTAAVLDGNRYRDLADEQVAIEAAAARQDLFAEVA